MPPPIASWSSLMIRLCSRSSLVDTFEPPTMPSTGRLGWPSAASQGLQLAPHLLAGVGRQQVGEALGRGVGAVGGGEGVVDVEVAERRQLLWRRPGRRPPRRRGSAGSRSSSTSPSCIAATAASAISPTQSSAKATGAPSSFASGADHRLQAHRGHALALRPVEVADQDHLGAAVAQPADGRQGGSQAGVVADLAVLQRHVEVDAHQGALAVHVDAVERAEAVMSRLEPQPSLPIASATSAIRVEKPHSLSYQDSTRTRLAVDHLGLRQGHGRRGGDVVEVDRDQRVLGHRQDAAAAGPERPRPSAPR